MILWNIMIIYFLSKKFEIFLCQSAVLLLPFSIAAVQWRFWSVDRATWPLSITTKQKRVLASRPFLLGHFSIATIKKFWIVGRSSWPLFYSDRPKKEVWPVGRFTVPLSSGLILCTIPFTISTFEFEPIYRAFSILPDLPKVLRG